MTERYIELHAASAFSFLEAASQPEQLIERAVALEMPAMALLDHNGVYGSARFHTSAKRNGDPRACWRGDFRSELRIAADAAGMVAPPTRRRTGAAAAAVRIAAGVSESLPAHHAVQDAGSDEGNGAATFEDLGQYAGGSDLPDRRRGGPAGGGAGAGRGSSGGEAVEQLTRIFGRENVYVELQRHQEREEEWRNQAALRIAHSLQLPVLATNGVRYATAYDREIQDLFMAIRHHVELDQAGRLLERNSRRYLRRAMEMAALFRDVPGPSKIPRFFLRGCSLS